MNFPFSMSSHAEDTCATSPGCCARRRRVSRFVAGVNPRSISMQVVKSGYSNAVEAPETGLHLFNIEYKRNGSYPSLNIGLL